MKTTGNGGHAGKVHPRQRGERKRSRRFITGRKAETPSERRERLLAIRRG